MFQDVADETRKIGEQLAQSTVMQLLIKLSFALYVSNYAYIRYDYFTSRIVTGFFPQTLYLLLKRLFYTLSFVSFFAFFFHILFVAPFDNLRRSLDIRVIRKDKEVNSHEKNQSHKTHDKEKWQTSVRKLEIYWIKHEIHLTLATCMQVTSDGSAHHSIG